MARTDGAFREWVTHPSTILAALLVVFGLLFVGVETQSPDWVYFTDHHVTGTVTGGIVFYKVAGKEYSLDDTRQPPGAEGSTVQVYYQKSDPGTALLDRPMRWIDTVAMLIWFPVAAILLVVAAARRTRRARRRRSEPHQPSW